MKNKGVLKKHTGLLCLFCFSVLSLNGIFASAVQAETVIKSVVIEGNRKIDTASIKARLSTKEGSVLSMDVIREDIRVLYSIGYFDDIKVDIEPYAGGVRLYIVVKEKPTIIRVDYAGNKEVSIDKIKEKVTLTPGSVADSRLIDDNVRKIRTLYETEGFWNSTVFPILRVSSDEKALVTFQIDEGRKVKVRNISFDGNTVFTDDELAAQMETKKKGLFSLITKSGKYVHGQMLSDLERIKNHYHNSGYITVKVGEPRLDLSEDKTSMNIVIPVEEGERFRVGTVTLTGPEQIPVPEVMALIRTSEGEWFNRGRLRSDVLAITEYYAERGFAFADIIPELNIRETENVVDLPIHVTENSLVRIGRINILGNTTTRDKVIRREVRLNEGDVYKPSLLKRSYERINNLKFFETVDIRPDPRPAEGTMDLNIKVTERPTGSLTIGGGYSTVDGLLATIEVTEGNLFGKGQILKVSAEKSDINLMYSLSFTEPWLFDIPLSLSALTYNQERQFDAYDKRAKGGGLSLGYSFTEYISSSIGYSYELADIFNVDDNAPEQIKGQTGERSTSKVRLSVTRNSQDNFLHPRRGSKNTFRGTLAGLGGDNAFYKLHYDSSWHFPLFEESAFSFRGRIGYADGLFGEELPLYERFYVGGMHTVRGYGYGDAGPKFDNGENKGGNKELIFNVEYVVPLVSAARLYGVVFYDAGAGFDDDEGYSLALLRQSAGAGFRWISPIGPLRLEWAMKLDPEEGESKSKWDFTIGTFF